MRELMSSYSNVHAHTDNGGVVKQSIPELMILPIRLATDLVSTPPTLGYRVGHTLYEGLLLRSSLASKSGSATHSH